jgi:7-keto-8-aminopelargonate synthetase-like enzyme
MADHDYILNKIRELRQANMLGLRILPDRAKPNQYRIRNMGAAPLTGFLSCSYLGLEWDERLRDGAIEAARACGTQLSSSIAIAALDYYGQFEELIRQMCGVTPILAATSTLAHLSAMPVLAGEHDAIILDTQVHNSVQMAARLCSADGTTVVRIAHNAMDELEQKIIELRNAGKSKIWYMADGLYSMYGDFVDLTTLFDLLARYDNFYCYVDDAHSIGWIGAHGEGYAAPYFGRPHSNKMVVTGSFAKGFGTGGSMILTENEAWRERIALCGETMIFSGPMHPPMLGAMLASARIMLSDELAAMQAELREKIRDFDAALRLHEIACLSSGKSPIFLLNVGSFERMKALSLFLQGRGFYAPPVSFPAVPLNKSCIRVTLNRLHEAAQMQGLIEAIVDFNAV